MRMNDAFVRTSDAFVRTSASFVLTKGVMKVVALGTATLVSDPTEKMEALHAFTEKIIAGRWADARPPSEKEMKATSILKLPLQEVSGKTRQGPVEDDAEDYALPVWAGVIPMRLVADPPVRDSRCDPALPEPAYASRYARPGQP